MRDNQSNIFPWQVLTTDGILTEIKPAQKIVSAVLLNCGDSPIYLWEHVVLDVGASFPITCDHTAYLSLSGVPVHFDTTGAIQKLVVMVERITDIKL